MSVAHGDMYKVLPDSSYAMWVRNELADYLRLPEGTRVEVIGGDFVVSPGPSYAHNKIVSGIVDALADARRSNPSFQWCQIQVQDIDMEAVGDGYIPDLVLIDAERDKELAAADRHLIRPGDISLAVEVTSKSTAANDRAPGLPRELRASSLTRTKWTGYARCDVPYYLLIDRDPRVAMSMLYYDPVPEHGHYTGAVGWKFGEQIRLPEPFAFDIDTGDWRPWDD
jgi:Uma2 family endonuclease